MPGGQLRPDPVQEHGPESSDVTTHGHFIITPLTCRGVPGAAAIETLAPRVTVQGQGLPRGHTQTGLGDHAGAL